MLNVKNSVTLLLISSVNPFCLLPSQNHRTKATLPESQTELIPNKESSLAISPLTYIDDNGEEKTPPSVGNEFRILSEEQQNNVMRELLDPFSPFFTFLCNNPRFSIDKTENIIVGERDDFLESDKRNCYNLATNTEHNHEYSKKFPGKALPKLDSENQQDNCDELAKNIMEEFGDDVRIVGTDEECNENEVGVKSYVSQEAFRGTQRDYHFVKIVDGSSSWEKRGEFAASLVNQDEIKKGRLIPKNNIWVETVNNNDELDGVGEIDGIGEISGIFTESSFTYDECDSFCLKMDRQSMSNAINR